MLFLIAGITPCCVFWFPACCNTVRTSKHESTTANHFVPLQIQYCYYEHACMLAVTSTQTVAMMSMRVTVTVLDGGCRTRALGDSWSLRWEAQPPLHTPISLAHTQIALLWVRTPHVVLYVVCWLWPPTFLTRALLYEEGCGAVSIRD